MTTPAQLTYEGQFNQVYLAIHKPAVVFSALVNQSFSAWDDVSEVTWDGLISGAYTDILPNMKLLVGSSAGAWDLGIARIRKAASSTKIYIGRQSDCRFADDMWLTVIDDPFPSARHWRVEGSSEIYMDQDVAYDDQNLYTNPMAVLGPDAQVWLTGANVTHQRDASLSWSPDGDSLTCAWSATGPAAVTIDNTSAANPVFTFTAVGEYRIALTLTTTHGKTTTVYRRTFVFGTGYLPATAFDLETIVDSHDDGGTSFKITLHNASDLTGTYDQIKVTLFGVDVYGNTIQSFGPLPGFENGVTWGWSDSNSIDWSPDHSTASFEIHGPAFWMDQIDILAAGGLKVDATGWLHHTAPTIDLVMYNLLYWRSNIAFLIDVLPSGDTRVAAGLVANNGSLWEQVKDIAGRIFSTPCCDRYGRLHLAVEPQMMPYASRSSIPVIMDITKADWRDRITIARRLRADVSQVYLGATDNADPYFSKSPGKIVMRWGKSQTKDNILVSGQAQTNQLAGDYLAWQNNSFPSVTIPLRGNNRLMDVAPNQYITLSVASGDTPLGLVWTSKRLIPRRVTYTRDPKSGAFLADLECEAETIGADGVTYTPPTVPDDPTPPAGPTGPHPLPPNPPGSIKRFGWDYLIGDNVNPILTGYSGQIHAPFYGNIDLVQVVAKPGTSGSIEIDLRRCTYAQIEPSVHPVSGDSLIGANAKPTLASAYKTQTDLTGWVTYLNLDDWIFIYVVSASGLVQVTLSIRGWAYQ
jgi:hypothetical protein